MALTRNYLKSMGLTDEQISSIIEAHSETVEALKGERDKYKEAAEKLPDVQRQLDAAKEAAKHSGDAEKIQKAFDDYKKEVEEREVKAAKRSALEKLAKDAGLTAAGIAKALKYTSLDFELDEKGDAKDGKSIIKSLREEWPEHIQTTRTVGADTPRPPATPAPDYDSMSDAEYYRATYEAQKGKK